MSLLFPLRLTVLGSKSLKRVGQVKSVCECGVSVNVHKVRVRSKAKTSSKPGEKRGLFSWSSPFPLCMKTTQEEERNESKSRFGAPGLLVDEKGAPLASVVRWFFFLVHCDYVCSRRTPDARQQIKLVRINQWQFAGPSFSFEWLAGCFRARTESRGC